jgi:hypothetical protein
MPTFLKKVKVRGGRAAGGSQLPACCPRGSARTNGEKKGRPGERPPAPRPNSGLATRQHFRGATPCIETRPRPRVRPNLGRHTIAPVKTGRYSKSFLSLPSQPETSGLRAYADLFGIEHTGMGIYLKKMVHSPGRKFSRWHGAILTDRGHIPGIHCWTCAVLIASPPRAAIRQVFLPRSWPQEPYYKSPQMIPYSHASSRLSTSGRPNERA